MIQLRNVSKIYEMGDMTVKALDHVTLNIEEGEFVAIIGPSGSGKSTMMNILGCLDIPTQGEYYLNKTLVSTYEDGQLAKIRNKEIGFVFQQFHLLSHLSAVENVTVPLTYSGMSKTKRIQIASDMLTKVGLKDRMYHKPTQLSGGQQQRVSIARALANHPSILLADEPTGALDTKTGKEVLTILKDLNEQGKTVIIITHEKEVAQFANRMIILRDGKVQSQPEVMA